LSTLVGKKGVLKSDERTTISRHIVAIEVSCESGGIGSLRVCVDEIDIVERETRVVIGLF